MSQKANLTSHFLVPSMNFNVYRVWFGGAIVYFLTFLVEVKYDRKQEGGTMHAHWWSQSTACVGTFPGWQI